MGYRLIVSITSITSCSFGSSYNLVIISATRLSSRQSSITFVLVNSRVYFAVFCLEAGLNSNPYASNSSINETRFSPYNGPSSKTSFRRPSRNCSNQIRNGPFCHHHLMRVSPKRSFKRENDGKIKEGLL